MASISLGVLFGYGNDNYSYGCYDLTFHYDSVTRSGVDLVIKNCYIKGVQRGSGYTTNTVYLNSCTIGSTSLGISWSGKGSSNSSWTTNTKSSVTVSGVAGSSTSTTVKWNGGRSGNTSAQNGSGTLSVPAAMYYLDLNGWLDGASNGGISGFGTADVYINGSRVSDDITDYYTQHVYGTTYEFKDIKAAAGHTYNGVHSGSLSGTITGATNVYLDFSTDTYTVSYNANGGSGAPGNQTKTYGVNLTLSGTKPTKARTSAGSYTVTLNYNGTGQANGSLTAARYNNYTFSHWNTNSSGTGTSYNSSATYSNNSAVTLYAIYNSTVSTDSVTLPSLTREGYVFLGWSTDASAAMGITGTYTPSGNVTFYAIWKQYFPRVSYKDASGEWISAESIKIKVNGAWVDIMQSAFTGIKTDDF